MEPARTESTAVAYTLTNRRQFAIKSLLIGGFLGGAAAMAAGGSLGQQAIQAAVLTAIIAGGLYWLVCALAAVVADEKVVRLTSRPASTVETTTTASASK